MRTDVDDGRVRFSLDLGPPEKRSVRQFLAIKRLARSSSVPAPADDRLIDPAPLGGQRLVNFRLAFKSVMLAALWGQYLEDA
jgi:hypothetical protein